MRVRVEDSLGREDTISHIFTGHLRNTQRPGARTSDGAGRISRQKPGVHVPACEDVPVCWYLWLREAVREDEGSHRTA